MEVFVMITEKVMLRSSLQYSDDRKKRYILSVEWDKDKKKACVIMLSSGQANGIIFDRTTTHCIENFIQLDYGSVDIVNLFATIGNGKSVIDDGIDEENLKTIKKSASSAEIIVFAVGTGKQNDKRVQKCQSAVLEELSEYKEKMFCIADADDRKFYHPLCPKVRKWKLLQFSADELTEKEQCADD